MESTFGLKDGDLMNKCFAMEKDRRFCDISEQRMESVTCYALSYDEYYRMKKKNLCLTKACPFYKEKRGDIRLD